MATGSGFRRILYTSIPAGEDFEADRLRIIEQSQRANGLDGITGVLWSAPDLYVQVLEGPADAVAETYGRIVSDGRHRSVTKLADTMEADRMFGAWAMTGLWGRALTVTTERLRDLVIESRAPLSDDIARRLVD